MPEFSYRDPEFYEKVQTKKTIEFWLHPLVKSNLVRFDFGSNNQWTAEYRSPLNNAGSTSEWRFLCTGNYTSSAEAIVHRVVLMLADKLRSVSQDLNDLNPTIKPIKQPTMSIISTVKKLTLKATNPDESMLREAGIHDDCGELTQDGKALLVEFLHDDYKTKLVEVAKQLIADKKI